MENYLELNEYYSELFRENTRIYTLLREVTSSEIGGELGVNGNTVSMFLHGQRHKRVDMFVAQAIANVLGVDLESLLVPNLLDLNPKMREFLYIPRNQRYVKALMQYVKSENIQSFKNKIKRIRYSKWINSLT